MVSVSDLRVVVGECLTALEGDSGVRKLLQALLSNLQTMRQDPSVEKAARSVALSLVNRMQTISPSTWPSGRREVFKRLSAGSVLGPGGADEIEAILPQMGIKQGHAERVVQKLIQEADALSSKLNSSLPVLKSVDIPVEVPSGERLRIIFREGTDIRDLDGLEREVRRWKRIISGLERYAGESASEIRVFDIRSGSLVIEVALASAVVLNVIFWATRSTIQILTKVEHLKQTRASTALHGKLVDAAVRNLDEAAKQLAAEAPKVILDDVTKRLNAEMVAAGTERKSSDPESIEAGKNAAEELVEFVEKGGRVALIGGDESRGAELENLNDRLEAARLDLQKTLALELKEPSD